MENLARYWRRIGDRLGQRLLRSACWLLLCGLLAPAQAGNKPAALPYSYFVTGDPNAPIGQMAVPSDPSFVLMGGGPDVDEAFRWMIQRAGVRPGTGGRFVVIRATGTEAYNPYIYYSDAASTTSSAVAADWVGGASLGLSSVETLVIPSVEAAKDPKVNAIVARAHAVFIAGGDQSDYIRFWKGTELEGTLNGLMSKNVPIGGTSAGLAVMGQFDFAALNGTVTSSQALGDPYNKYMSFDPAPLSLSGGFIAPPALANIILDSHLDSRDRMGRLIAFVARLVAPVGSAGCAGGLLAAGTNASGSARAIGIDVETALLVQGALGGSKVTARRVTNPGSTSDSAVYFVRPLLAPTTCATRKPLTVRNVEIKKLANSATEFDLGQWTGLDGYFVDAIGGQLSSSPY